VSRLAALTRAAAAHRLTVSGIVSVMPGDGLPPRIRSVVLLSPDEPAFWPHVTAQPEFGDGAPGPLDRWSRRVIGALACDLGGKAWFPFGGPPWRPFTAWALRSGQAFTSPVGLLVHATRGLFISWRGAIGLEEALSPTFTRTLAPALADSPAPGLADSPAPALADSPAPALADTPAPALADSPAPALADTPAQRPCDTCAAPCMAGCPVDAFAGGRYDVAACHAYLVTGPGADCLIGGCRVRRACPVGAGNRQAAQSAFHMKAFHPR